MYYNLGRQLASKGQDEKAEAQLKISVEKDPDFKKSRVELGLIYKKTGRHDLALAEFQRAKEIDPKDHEALYQLAVVSLQTGKFAEAGKLFEELLAEFPEREEFALGGALAAKYQGKDEDYRKGREAGAKLFPAESRYVYEMGGVAESQKDTALAAEFYRRALEAALAEEIGSPAPRVPVPDAGITRDSARACQALERRARRRAAPGSMARARR